MFGLRLRPFFRALVKSGPPTDHTTAIGQRNRSLPAFSTRAYLRGDQRKFYVWSSRQPPCSTLFKTVAVVASVANVFDEFRH